MGDALISQVIEQFAVVTRQKIEKEYRLVVGVEKDIENIAGKTSSKICLRMLREVRKMEIARNADIADRKKVCFSFIPLSCFDFSRVVHRRDIAVTIHNINERLNEIACKGHMFSLNRKDVGGEESQARPRSSSSIEAQHVYGREDDKSTLLRKLCFESGTQAVKETIQIISIVGLGGIGKTTLAKLVYNCDEVSAHFEQLIWVCVSDPYDEVRVAKAIVESIERSAPDVAEIDNFVDSVEKSARQDVTELEISVESVRSAPDVAELETALQLVKRSLNGKKFLLVLDDVGKYHHRSWEQLECNLKKGAPGSRVLVTTRNEGVARLMNSSYIHPLGRLSDQNCWSLFSRTAFNGKTEEEKERLEDIGRRISDKCKGLPLSVYTISGLMRLKSTAAAWRDVLKSEFWDLNGAEEDLSPPLLLSYYDLSSKLRQCFIYCAQFPKSDYIEADNLMKLWMAQGYLTSADMEATGRSYLDDLIMRCFFQNLEINNKSGIVTRFMMHDIVHDFAQYFTKTECFIVKPETEEQQVYTAPLNSRHLTLIRGEYNHFPEIIKNSEKLHTLWVQSFYDTSPTVNQVNAISSKLFHHLKYLRALDLSHNRLLALPNEIDKVINLRYLNLSFNPLEKLPESVCDLYNLQTLKLVACEHLTMLPQGMWKLENMRHLEIDRTDNLTILPKGISQLSTLRTLTKFVIRGDAGVTNEISCKIGDLRNLNSLEGCLYIEGLGSVADACEAKMAQLEKKEDLLMVFMMNFTPSLVQTEHITCNVAEALRPHPNLVQLEIKSYGGSYFPSWIVLLSQLKSLVILECQNCEQLPSLGELPLLERLHIESINNLKCVDHRFLYSNPGFVGEKIVFPKLKTLEMRSLEEWDLTSNSQVDCKRIDNDAKPRLLEVFRIILQQRYGTVERITLSHIPRVKVW
ncbi:putative disease resistance protein RGA4 [Heracleum sosnowskyi]|uniref:Disease resistance protein RGA4 n=1 Tax=Heracleum sosnowskyi TaxID=360622 RepID=A0AAD8H564_9APIA|nr:putative disease resistance protein RGA4 [Heracleum sosnowskyi]